LTNRYRCPDGKRLNTLREAIAYLAKAIPKSERNMADNAGADRRHEGIEPPRRARVRQGPSLGTSVDANVAAFHPPKLLELRPERGQVVLKFGGGLSVRHEHANAFYLRWLLLCTRRERQGNRSLRSAE
jgi:hypothetical protein